MKQQTAPLSVRIPQETQKEIKRLAERDRRSMHSMIVILIDFALATLREAEQGSSNAASAFPTTPAVLFQGASGPEAAH